MSCGREIQHTGWLPLTYDKANGMQILISQRLDIAVKVSVAVGTVGELSLKGISRPILVSNISGRRATPCHESEASLPRRAYPPLAFTRGRGEPAARSQGECPGNGGALWSKG
jgi:hypothetical protein